MTPAGAMINATVNDVSGDTLLLELFSGMRDPMDRLAGETLTIQFASRRGICRVEGQASRVANGPTAMQFAAAGKPEVVQRRDWVRVDAMIPVVYKPIGMGGWTVETNTINVSAGGFLVADPEGLRLGQTMRFTLELGEDEEPLEVTGTAVRETRGGALGVQIVDIDKDDRERLVHWVFARERLGRQITRDG